jgi:hypothetical protein
MVFVSTFGGCFLEMNEQRILEDLVGLLEGQGVQVRTEPLGGGGGGLCSLKGESIFFVDTQSSAGENAARCAEAVAKMADIEAIYITPEVRQFIERQTRR